MTRGTPRAAQFEDVGSGCQRHARRCASALDAVDEHRDAGRRGLDHQGAHRRRDRRLRIELHRDHSGGRKRKNDSGHGPPLAVGLVSRAAPDAPVARAVNGASGLNN